MTPEEIMERIASGEFVTTHGWAYDLGVMTRSPLRGNAEDAIRLLGFLAEEGLLPDRYPLRCILEPLITHKDAWRRYYAVEAAWIAGVHKLRPVMKAQLKWEDNDEVRDLLQRAIKVLGR